LAQGRFSLLLMLEIAIFRRPTADRHRAAGVDRRISIENPLWGAPRTLKLGFEVAQSSVAKYMVKLQRPPGQGWRTFLCNHAPPPWTCR